MESTINEGLISLNWPSREEYERRKSEFKITARKNALEYLNNDISISGFTDQQKEFGSELSANFLWGVQMVYEASGYKGVIPKLEIWPTDKLDLIGIANPIDDSLSPEKFIFIFARHGFEKLLKDATEGGKDPNDFIERFSGMPIQKHFELTGVEEMLHILYLSTKKTMGKPPVRIPINNISVFYHSSDIEESALIWQVAYTKRYMPDYYNSTKSLLDKVVAVREAHRLKYKTNE